MPDTDIVCACPRAEEHWIEIELQDGAGRAVPNEEFVLELPDGRSVGGFLGPDGHIRIASIEAAGECRVRFPRLDRDAWRYLGAAPAREPPIL